MSVLRGSGRRPLVELESHLFPTGLPFHLSTSHRELDYPCCCLLSSWVVTFTGSKLLPFQTCLEVGYCGIGRFGDMNPLPPRIDVVVHDFGSVARRSTPTPRRAFTAQWGISVSWKRVWKKLRMKVGNRSSRIAVRIAFMNERR